MSSETERDKIDQTPENLVQAFNQEAHSSAMYATFVHLLPKDECAGVHSLFSACSFSQQVHAARHAKVALFLGRDVTVSISPLQEEARPETVEDMFQAMRVNIAGALEQYPIFIEVAEQEEQHLAILSFDGALKSNQMHLEHCEQFMANPALLNNAQIHFYVCSLCGMIREVNKKHCPVCGAGVTKFVEF